ncbi:MAG: DUF3592 domain-containing protein [Planctomycetota bacterium]
MAPKLLSPANVAAAAFATALGLLSVSQWRASQAFTADAITTQAKITELRTAKRGILDGSADTFAKVEFDNPGAGDPEQSYSAELPTPIDQLGLDAATAVGSTITVRYDPTHPQSVRYGKSEGSEGAWILAALALGALFVPTILRRSALAQMGGGGGG